MLTRLLLSTALIVAIGTGSAGAQSQIEIFSNDAYPVSGIEAAVSGQSSVRYYNLDAPAHLEDELSADLPADPEAAARQARARLDRLGEDRLRKRIATAWRGQLRAAELGVDRLPAVVFDRQAVVYGVTGLAEAIRHYRRWRRHGGVPGR